MCFIWVKYFSHVNEFYANFDLFMIGYIIGLFSRVNVFYANFDLFMIGYIIGLFYSLELMFYNIKLTLYLSYICCLFKC
jgi:hypothetical protein